MDGTTARVAATLDALRRIPGCAVPEALDGLVARMSLDDPGIAVVGLFNRGKSTLFNAIVGAAVSPVSVMPETSVPVSARTGPEAATAGRGGSTQTLPCEPEAFASTIARDAAVRWQWAEVSGPFRLPRGLRLIDTPGINEAVGSDETVFANALPIDVVGALLVVGVPPGVAAQDLDLLRRVHSFTSGNVGVVVNRLSSEIDEATLDRIVGKVRAATGRDPVVVPPRPPVGGWAQDPAWRPIEELLEQVQREGQGIVSRLRLDLEHFVNREVQRIRVHEWTADERPELVSVIRMTEIDLTLRLACEGAVARIGDSRRRAEAEAEEARRKAEEARLKEEQRARARAAAEKKAREDAARREALETQLQSDGAMLNALYSHPVQNLPEWHHRRRDLVGSIKTSIHALPGPFPTTSWARHLVELLDYDRRFGDAWASNSAIEVTTAKDRIRSLRTYWRWLFAFSFLGWGLSLLLLDKGYSFGHAFLVWILSAGLWVGSTVQIRALSRPDAWRSEL